MVDYSTTIVDLSVREKTFDEEIEEKFAGKDGEIRIMWLTMLFSLIDKLRGEYFENQKKLKQKEAEEEAIEKANLQKKKKIQLLEKSAHYRPFTFGFDGKPLFLKKNIKAKDKLIPNNTR